MLNFFCVNLYAANIAEIKPQKFANSRMVQTSGYNFDSQDQPFYNKCANGLIFTSTIPNGAISQKAVKFIIPAGLEYKVIKDDEDFKYSSGSLIPVRSEGYYELKLINTNKKTPELNMDEQRFVFRILDTKTPINSTIFNAPDGFGITQVSVMIPGENEEEVKSSYQLKSLQNYKFKEDGTHIITCTSNSDSRVMFTNQIIRKSKPGNILTLTGVTNGRATSKVVTYKLEPGATLEILKDGNLIKNTNGNINSIGNYRLTASDFAGNRVVYEFKYSYQPSPITYVFALTLAITVIGGVLYFLNIKNRIDIR